MRTAVYLCTCNSMLADRLDIDRLCSALEKLPDVDSVMQYPAMCGEEGMSVLLDDLRDKSPDRIIVAGCSPRNKEEVFCKVLEDAGINPLLMQIANIREQVVWVTRDRAAATRKALSLISAAVARVQYHRPIEKKRISLSPDVMVVGAGPAGLSAAHLLAEAGRKVILVEKLPSPGGMPVLFAEIFPNRACGPCLLQPVLDALLHDGCSGSVELLTLSRVRSMRGVFGNYEVTIEQSPRYVDTARCIGCAECVNACPVSVPAERGIGRSRRKAIDFLFAGAMPHVPHIDAKACQRMNGKKACSACRDACPVEGAIRLDDAVQEYRRTVGAVVLATGASLLDSTELPGFGQGKLADVMTSLVFERMLASDGPTKGKIRGAANKAPSRIAIVHCVGSLDEDYKPYCSAVCCRYALKYRAMIREQLPEATIIHLVKEWCLPGQAAQSLVRQALPDGRTKTFRYRSLSSLNISPTGNRNKLSFQDDAGKTHRLSVDMVILCPAIVPHEESAMLADLFAVRRGVSGFFEEEDDDARISMNGIASAGACRAPVDIRTAMEQGRAVAGRLLARLRERATLEILPAGVRVDPDRCSGCMLCIQLCPAKAIEPEADGKRAVVHDVLCTGCGICVAACPTHALYGGEFSSEALSAELKGMLEQREE